MIRTVAANNPQELIDLMPVGVYVVDRAGVIRQYNKRAAEMWGREPRAGEADRYCGAHRLYHPDGREITRDDCAMADVLVDGRPRVGIEVVIERPDGERLHAVVNISALRDDSGAVVGAINCFQDVTALKRAGALLAESEARYRRIIETAAEGVGIVDARGVLMEVNPRLAEMLGRGAGELIGRPLVELLDASSFDAFTRQWDERRAGLRGTYELSFRRGDGEVVHATCSATPLYDRDGLFVGSFAMLNDITYRKRVEQELRRQLEVTAAITANAAECMFLMDARGVATFANPAAVETFGYSADELRGARLHDLIHYKHPDGRAFAMIDCPLGSVLSTGRTMTGHEDVFVRKDGTFVPVECSVSPIMDGGRVAGAVLVVHDISDRKRAEAHGEHRAGSLKLLSDNATRLLMHDNPGEILGECFEELARHIGVEVYFNYLASEDGRRLRLNASGGVGGRLAAELGTLDYGQAVCGQVAAERVRRVVDDVQGSDDPRVDVVKSLGVTAYVCTPLVAHGRLIGTLSFGSRGARGFDPDDLELIQAVSEQAAMALERARLSAELQGRAKELADANAAKDQFLAALSHELRTPLAPVLMTAAALEGNPDLPADVREDLAMIHRNVELEARLIDDLLDLTRISRGKLELHAEAIDAHQILREAVNTCCRSDINTKRQKIVLELEASHPVVWADGPRLQQVFWNLLKNAIKFTPGGGEIRVRTRNVTVDDEGVRVAGASAAAGVRHALVIEVTDSGVGIDPEALPHIFDAFEQGGREVTRRFGGLGLGLAITRALVDMHGGTIAAASEGIGKGATFTVSLTTVPKPARSFKALGDGQGAAERRGLRILLVEDHESTANVLARLLKTAGHDVRVANTVKDAMERAGERPFDLLISDLGLPDGNGLELMAELKARYAFKAIALSGYGMEEDLQRSREAGFSLHLTKPVDFRKLQSAIVQVAN